MHYKNNKLSVYDLWHKCLKLSRSEMELLLLTNLFFLIIFTISEHGAIFLCLFKSQTCLEMASKTGQRRKTIQTKTEWNCYYFFSIHSVPVSTWGLYIYFLLFWQLRDSGHLTLHWHLTGHWSSKRVSRLTPPLSHLHGREGTLISHLNGFQKEGTFLNTLSLLHLPTGGWCDLSDS